MLWLGAVVLAWYVIAPRLLAGGARPDALH
jgi:hypothetical protein